MIYMDNAATTKVRPEVAEVMLPYFDIRYANPSGIYAFSQNVRHEINQARRTLALSINADENEIFITSGGTESDNWALKMTAAEHKNGHIITTKIEHHAIIRTCEYLENNGIDVTYVDTDEYGNVNIYMLPFLKPALFKNSMPEEAAAGEDAIIKKLVENTDIDKNERNIILAHQFFVSGHKEPELCESEQTPAIVGGLDAVDVSAFDDFEYAALGHIHGGQFVGSEKNRYSGTPIKFSVSERNHNKNIVMVDMEEKNKEIEITKLPLTQIRDVKKLTGYFDDIIASADEELKNDYVSK